MELHRKGCVDCSVFWIPSKRLGCFWKQYLQVQLQMKKKKLKIIDSEIPF